jgi:hypothetical protein
MDRSQTNEALACRLIEPQFPHWVGLRIARVALDG